MFDTKQSHGFVVSSMSVDNTSYPTCLDRESFLHVRYIKYKITHVAAFLYC